MQCILASASPRRERLLARVLRTFSVVPVHVCERVRRHERFVHACRRLARAKARAAAERHPGAVVVGADTIAYLGRRNFRKTDDARKARAALLALSGRTHTVATGVCVVFPGGREVSYCERARVRMKRLAPALLEWYMETGEWRGRAGSYDVSGKGARLVAEVKGEKETVAGLPLRKLKLILKGGKGKGVSALLRARASSACQSPRGLILPRHPRAREARSARRRKLRCRRRT